MAIITKKADKPAEKVVERTDEDNRSDFAKATAAAFRKIELVRREVFKNVKSVVNKPQDFKVG